MKKLALTLWSCMMLFLGIGAAWAQDAPVILSTPTFTPSSGTVAPGTEIKFTLEENFPFEDYSNVVFVLYVENAPEAVLESDESTLWGFIGGGIGGFTEGEDGDGNGEGSELAYKIGMGSYDEELTWPFPVKISKDVSGEVKFRARLAAISDEDGVVYSEEMTATYTVEGEVAKPTAPTFYLGETAIGEATATVDKDAEVTLSNGYAEEEATLNPIYYKVNGADADFEISDATVMMAPDFKALTAYTEGDKITISENQTIKAATAQINTTDMTVVWSDITTVEFTVKASEVVASPKPSFNPETGSEIESGSTVTISAEFPEGETDYWIYYVLDKPDFDFTQYTKDEDLDEAGGICITRGNSGETAPLTKATTIKAATCKYKANGDRTYTLSAWSEPATATYTIKATEPAEKPTAPTFNPAGGEVPVGTKVVLTNGYDTDKTKVLCYATKAKSMTEGNLARITTKDELKTELKKQAYLAKIILYPEGGIAITKNMDISAMTADTSGETVVWSDVVSYNFTLKKADKPEAPTFSPDGGEVGDDDNTVTLTMSAADRAKYADIWYVVNGTGNEFNVSESTSLPRDVDPEAEGKLILYEGPITITKSQKISAAVVWEIVPEDEEEDDIMASHELVWSEVVTKEFTFTGTPVAAKPAQPVIKPGNDASVHMGDKITITCETEDVTIRYTTDGKNPTAESAVYTEPFALTEAMLIPQMEGKVFALKINAAAFKGDVMSDVVEVGLNAYPDAPTFTPDGSEEVEAGTTVAIACVPSVAKIYYTLDGTTPDDEGSNATLYTEPIEITETTTIKARAILGQYTGSTTTAMFTVAEGEVKPDKPTFDPEAGEVFKGTELTWEWDESYEEDYFDLGVIYVANGEDEDLNLTATEILQAKENTPDDATREDGTVYVYDGYDYDDGYTINKDVTVKARFYAIGLNLDTEGGEEPGEEDMILVLSDIETAAYTVKTIATPVISPNGGEVEKGTEVTITCETEGAYIMYTLDGTTPSLSNGDAYKDGEKPVIDEALTLKAVAVVQSKYSEVAEATYTIKTANEGLELAGVSVYPNPSEGEFTLDLPVAATVEVFGLTGVVMQRIEAGAGLVTLNIERGGIYFLRITADGRATVKRVVVR